MKRLLLPLLLLTAPGARAQRPTVEARVEPDSVMIGDRFDYVIEVEKDLVQVVNFPVFRPGDNPGGLVLVEDAPVDTLLREGRRLKLRKRYRLAVFEEGHHNFGPAEVLYADKNIVDTLRTGNDLELNVATFEIDSTSQSIYDLKPQRGMPFRMGEISGYLLRGLLALLLLALLAVGGYCWLRRRGSTLGQLFRAPAPLPPHVEAIRALEALHHQKLWQNNRHKQYYSGLTDILRTYMARRWEIGAMEMTSDEILTALRPLGLPDKARTDLAALLRDADLVKFAKAAPGAEENETHYLNAYYFVEETKPATEQAEETPENR
ncbi:MAG: hypothetical protein K2L06_06235 [Alistipes sp.]|nr:hypothetical protein [Alistipes sp.]